MAGSQLSISTVMTGESLTDISTGAETVAMDDFVVLAIVTDGHQLASSQMTVEQAMQVASGLSAAAGRILNARVGDNGKPLPAVERLAILARAARSS